MLNVEGFQEELLRAIREQTDRIIAEEIEKASAAVHTGISSRIRELAMNVSIEIAKRFEVAGNETVITVRYKP